MDMFFPDEAEGMEDEVTGAAMVDALIQVGTDPDAARSFTAAIVDNSFDASFMEVYGRGAIMHDANGPRRALNIKGLGALDIRTFKPNGDACDFNKRADRNEARSLID